MFLMFSQVIVSHIFWGLKLSVSDCWPIQLMFCWSSVDGSRLGPEKMPRVPISTPCKYWYWCIVTRKEIKNEFIMLYVYIYIPITMTIQFYLLEFYGIWSLFLEVTILIHSPKFGSCLRTPRTFRWWNHKSPPLFVLTSYLVLLHEQMVQMGQQMVTNGNTW